MVFCYDSLHGLIKVAFLSWVYNEINDNAFVKDLTFIIVNKNQMLVNVFGIKNDKLFNGFCSSLRFGGW